MAQTQTRRTTLSEYSSIASLLIAVVYVVRDLLPDEQKAWYAQMLKALPPRIFFAAMLFFLAMAVLGGLRRLRRLEAGEADRDAAFVSRMLASEQRVGALAAEVQTLETKLDGSIVEPQPSSETSGERVLPPYLDVVWPWDATLEQVTGPVCPKHRTQLGYKSSHGDPVFNNFEDKYIGGSGWFICPIDNETFPDPNFKGPEKVERAREFMENRYRAIHKLAPKPKRPPTPQELELLRQVQENLRRMMQRKGRAPSGRILYDGSSASKSHFRAEQLPDAWKDGKPDGPLGAGAYEVLDGVLSIRRTNTKDGMACVLNTTSTTAPRLLRFLIIR